MINEASERLRRRPIIATAVALATAGVFSLLAFLAVSEEGQVSRLQAQAAGVLTRPFINKGLLINQEYPEAFELDRWQQEALMKPFQADCPLRFQRPTIEELQSRDVRPYLFGGAQRPACKNCHVAGSRWQRKDFCHYTFHHGTRVCPHDDQDRLLQHFLDRAQSGSQWAANMLQLTPCDLWPFIQGRTIWLMGDSIMQEFMLAMECFFFEWYPDRDDEGSFGRVFVTNNTEAIEKSMKEGGVGPWCVPLPEGSRICHLRTNMGTDWAENVVPVLPELGALPTDIVVGNFAVWINNDTEYADNIAAFSKTYKSMVDQLPFFIWRDASVQHFSTHTGDYNGAPYPFHCQPIGGEDQPGVSINANGSLESEDPELEVVLKGGWRNEIAYRMIPELDMPIMRTWNETVPIHFLHHHYNFHCGDALQGCPDCTHTCHPGYYQTWIYNMFETMMASQEQMLQHFSTARRGPGL